MPAANSTGHDSRPAPAVARWQALVLLVALAGLCGGCGIQKSMKNAFGDFAEDLFPPSPGQAAKMAISDYDPDKRRRATALISASPFGGDDVYVRFYRKMLETEPDPTVQTVLIRALGDHGAPPDAAIIAKYLNIEKHPVFIRWEAAKALRKIHNPVVTNALVDAMRKDEDAGVRAAAADALGQYAEPAVFQTLVGGLDDKHFSVVLASENSLKTLTGADNGADGGKWLAWATKNESDMFANQQIYTWMPYVKPRGFMDNVTFWKKKDGGGPMMPAGAMTQEDPAQDDTTPKDGEQVSTTSG